MPKEAFGAVTLAKTYRFSLTVSALLPTPDLDRHHPHPLHLTLTLASTLTQVTDFPISPLYLPYISPISPDPDQVADFLGNSMGKQEVTYSPASLGWS